MNRAELEFEVKESRLLIRCKAANLNDRRKVTTEDAEQFTQWIESYRLVLKNSRGKDNHDTLLKVGREIYGWLNGAEGWMEKLFVSIAQPPFIMELTVSAEAGEEERRFLEVPWELAANEQGHLAADPYRLYMPVRRVGKRGKVRKPSDYRLHAVFMAAAPREVSTLRFEEEETAILDAAGSLGMDLTVEESGSPELLGECTARENKLNPVDVLHISCHGTYDPKDTEKENPLLVLETEEGEVSPTTAAQLDRVLGGNKPGLLFLSACMSSEPGAFFTSLSASMIRRGVPAVLGWGGSVRDVEATHFAKVLYGYLSRGEELEEAAARARAALLEKGESIDRHLARLYLGGDGGGTLCGGNKAFKRRGPDYGHKEFLNVKDKEIPVAGRREFVGRRRQLQAVLREFRRPEHAGVLLHGFGRQGKSSLAARAANRMTDHKVVVVYGHYDAVSVLEAMEYFAGTPGVRELVSAAKERVREDGAALFGVLKDILEGPCFDEPVLLVLDDFERALEEPGDGELHRVKSHLVDAVRSVIEAFDSVSGNMRSRLLVTCRYVFTLPHRGRDLVSRLLAVPLPPMEDYEGRKQAAAKEKALGIEEGGVDGARMERCVRAGRGNPGLQDLLFSLCLNSPEAGDAALTAVEEYLSDGRELDGEKLREFIGNLAVKRLLGLLSPGERELLRASTLFSVPVPLDVLAIMGRELGVKVTGKERVGERLLGFGLWEPFEDMVDREVTAAAIHALARPEAGSLSEEEIFHLSGLVVKALFNAWGGEDREKRPVSADIELARLALAAREAPVLSVTAEDAVRGLEKRFQYRAAAQLGVAAIRVLDTAGGTVSAGLLLAVCEVSVTTGDMGNARSFIARALETFSEKDKETEDYAYALLTYGRMLKDSGSPDRALSLFEEAKGALKSDRFLRERGIVLGEIAKIKLSKGQVDEALTLHKEELQVYDELGDRRSRAVTLGDIARILVDRGQVDEALTLLQEKLKIVEELGNIDSKAATLWDLAQIELQRESFQTAFDYLTESYSIFIKLDRLDGICMVGLDLGQLLCGAGDTKNGLEILQRSREGFRKLGWNDKAAQAEELIEHFSKKK